MRAALLVTALLLALPAAAQDPPPAPPAPPVAAAGDGLDVLDRLPPDARAKLTGDQLADIIDNAQRMPGRELENILVPTVFFATIIGVVFLVLWARWRREQKLHETLRAMIDKGVEIPPALLVPPHKKPDDRRRGVLLTSTGAGLCIFLYTVDRTMSGAWALGLVPVFLGAGYLLAHLLERKQATPTTSAEA